MELQAMLLLLFACGSLSKENLPQIRAMPGVNSRKVITREAQPFYCTNTTKDSTTSRKLPVTSDSALNQPKSQSTNDRPATVPSTIQQTTRPPTNQQNHNSQSSSDSPTTIKMIEITTEKFQSTPPQTAEMLSTRNKSQLKNSGTETAQSPMKQITNLSNHYNFTAEPPLTPSPADRELTSDQQTTKQLIPTLSTAQPSDPRTTNQVILTSLSSLNGKELTSGQQTTGRLISTPLASPPWQKLTSELKTTSQLTSSPITSPPRQELIPKQHITGQLISIPSTSPTDQELITNQQICAPNMVLRSTCDCADTSQDPTSCNCSVTKTCVCAEGFLMDIAECVPEHECHYHEEEQVAKRYVNENCTKKCTCNENHFSCDPYTCSPRAECREENGVRRCYCNEGYVGDGKNCYKPYKDCFDAYQDGIFQDGALFILPSEWPRSAFKVWCNMTTSGGGWTVLQRRPNGGGFQGKNWKDYTQGFGSISGNHWLGNEKIFYLTNQRNYTLRVDLVSSDTSTTYQEYSLFKIANERDNYRLVELGNNDGTAGDGMDGLLGQQFSTKDRDNDGYDDINCSKEHEGRGWWYSNEWRKACCTTDELGCFNHSSSDCKMRCTKANLNGIFRRFNEVHTGIFWNNFHSITSTEMKIRPANTREDTI